MTLPRRRAPVKPIFGTILALVASATHDNPRPGCREPGPPSREARGAGLGAGTRVRERRTRIRLQARRVHNLANRSRKHAVCGAGTRPCARVGTARAGDVSPVAQAGCSSSVASPSVDAGRAARGAGAGQATTTGVALSLPLRHVVATGDDVNRRSPRRAGSSVTAAGDTKPSPSSSVETGVPRRNQHAPGGATTRGRALPRTKRQQSPAPGRAPLLSSMTVVPSPWQSLPLLPEAVA